MPRTDEHIRKRTKQHLEMFSKVYPERLKEMRQLFAEKDKLDKAICKKRAFDEEDKEALIKLIGKDHLFAKAESRKNTIRHAVFKLKSSLYFYQNNREFILNYLQQSEWAKKIKLRAFVEHIEYYSEFFRKKLEELES